MPEGRDDKAAKSVTDEEEVFWIILSITEHLVPNLHDSSMHVQVEASVFMKLLALREIEHARRKNLNQYQQRSDGIESVSTFAWN